MTVRLSVVEKAEFIIQPSQVFDAEGGDFGRSPQCKWVLPDPQRVISSVHGHVLRLGKDYLLFDDSTNGIFMEGRLDPLGRGNSIVLRDGMQFRVGGLWIKTDLGRILQPAAVAPVQTGGGYGAYRQPSPANTQTQVPDDAARSLDPLAYLLTQTSGAGPAPSGRPAAVPAAPQPLSTPAAVSGRVETAPAMAPLIPDNYDPLASAMTSSLPLPDSVVVQADDEMSAALESGLQGIASELTEAPVGSVLPDFDPLELLGARRESHAVLQQQRAADLMKELPDKIVAEFRPAEPDLPPVRPPLVIENLDVTDEVAEAALPAFSLDPLMRGMRLPLLPSQSGNAAIGEEAGRLLRIMVEGLLATLSSAQMLRHRLGMEDLHGRAFDNSPLRRGREVEEILDALLVSERGSERDLGEHVETAFAALRRQMLLMTEVMEEAVQVGLESRSSRSMTREFGARLRRGLAGVEGAPEDDAAAEARRIIADCFADALDGREDQYRDG